MGAFYGAAIFLAAACGLIIEIVAGRLLAPYVGMSLYTWTAIIAVVLAGFSAGNWIGGLLASPAVGRRRGARRVAMALALASASTIASLALLRVLSGPIMTSGLGSIPVIVLLSVSLFLLPSLFVGIVSPILTKLAVDAQPDNPGRVIGRMYALGALGSIAGTLSSGYLFISWIGSTGTVISVAVVYAVMALGFAAVASSLGRVLPLLVAATGGLGWWGEALRAFESPCRVESDYFCIRVEDFRPQSGRDSAIMVLDHLAHSINDKQDPGLLYSPYIHFVDEAARRWFGEDGVGSAFFIGGGAYTLPRAWSADYGEAELVVAEIDPKVTQAARDFMWLPESLPGLKVVHQDARMVLQGLPEGPRFDVVFGDAFHDISIPPHLVTVEFNHQVAARLKPGGFYAVNVADDGLRPLFLLAMVRTLARDFPVVEVWADSEQIGASGRVTFVVMAANRPSPAARIDSARGFGRTWVRWPEDDLTKRVAQSGAPVLSDDFAPVDRLMARLLKEAP